MLKCIVYTVYDFIGSIVSKDGSNLKFRRRTQIEL